MRRVLSFLIIFLAAGSQAAMAATEIAAGVYLERGAFAPNVQPDGNSVIFTAPGCLIVMDTGRHASHTQKLVDFSRERRAPVKAVINSHWHLDHVGGNPRMRREFPLARFYASDAIKAAMGGFLAGYRSYLVDAIAKETADAKAQQALQAELAIIDAGPALFPDEIVAHSGDYVIAGRKLTLHLESYAVSGGDIWVFDAATKVLAAGDLVTLPVPFLDTACPKNWSKALDNIARTDFELLLPGHGEPMRRDAFATYRDAFNKLLRCAASDKSNAQCADAWVADAGVLIAEQERKFSKAMMTYYMENSLRADPARISKLCGE